MKANELFVGAYVLYMGKPRKIRSIEVDKDGYYYIKFFGKNDVIVSPDVLSPIPTTTKILEKNGFIACQYWHELHCGDAIIQAQLPHIRMKNGEKIFESDSCCYLHQLQQALCLCEIEKEIIL